MKSAVTVVGVAWFRPEQWPRLREVSADADLLELTHAEWLIHATRTLKRLRKTGIDARKVPVDVEKLLEWCEGKHRPVDGSARADYAARTLSGQ